MRGHCFDRKANVQFDLTEGHFSAQQASLCARHNDVADFVEKIPCLLDRQDERVKMNDFGKRRVENELEWKYEEPKLLAAYTTLFED